LDVADQQGAGVNHSSRGDLPSRYIKRTRGPAALLALLCVAACATTPDPLRVAAPFSTPGGEAGTFGADIAAPAPAPRRGDGIGRQYTIAKIGTFMPSGDIEHLNDGVAAEVIFGRALLPFLAVEGSLGYLAADGNFLGTHLDLWAIPVFVNARASVPVLFFEPYAGVGIGGMYVDYKASGVYSNTDFVSAWDTFIGLEVGLGRLAVGAEYKYVQSSDTKDHFAIEGSSATLFVSLPF
jgi:hypothetical protein